MAFDLCGYVVFLDADDKRPFATFPTINLRVTHLRAAQQVELVEE